MTTNQSASYRFHEATDNATIKESASFDFEFFPDTFTFQNFFHPLVGSLINQLNTATGDPIAAMLDPSFLSGPGMSTPFFASEYTAGSSFDVTSFNAQIDLDHELPYANYNWELAYHIPIAVAVHLSQNQRFAEAQKWFHYVFDPTSTDPTDPNNPSGRFWKFLYFRQNPQSVDLSQLITWLSKPLSSSKPSQVQDLLKSYKASLSTPFEPFAVARSRPIAFQYYVVMKYLDNLIAWGDSLFTQMTIETVNEATLCYVLAANLLGPRPQPVPPIGTASAACYNDLKNGKLDPLGLDPLGDALVALEGQFPFNITTGSGGPGTTGGSIFGTGQSLYFCVPANAQLLGYWDTVEDRLTKIRKCESITGQVQLMPLFDPPIAPGMLIAAAAAGLDIGSVVSGLNQPISPVRAPPLIRQALELCSEVRSLGSGLLSAIEKGDAEALARLRQNNEIALQKLTQNGRYLHWQQAQAATEALLRSRASALERYTFYLRELGLTPDPTTVPASFTVDHTTVLTEDNFADAYQALVGQYDQPIATQPYPALQLAQSASPSAQSGASGSGSLYLNANEDAELNTHMPTARDENLAASVLAALAAPLRLIPTLNLNLEYWGIGATSKIFGGDVLADTVTTAADILRMLAAWQQAQGAMAARTAGYQRRADDWLLQANLAARELSQLGRQILASLLAEQAAGAEYATAKAQVGQAQDVLTFLQTKFSSQELYGWMQGQLSSLYYQYYRLALDTARKAEATMKWELMRPELDAITYIQPNYWNSGYQGLLTGEALYLDIKSMELDYQTYNLRELELTLHVSLRQLDPLALLQLKTTRSATVTIPEWFYDRSGPGHYLRRLKTVAVSIPSVVGPYAVVPCTLTLQNSSVRISPALTAGAYQRSTTSDDPRFVDYFGTVDSIVTSGAVSDSGMFETNLRDDRFLPFEGAGAISTWGLSLPAIPSFDYSTITDVVITVRINARDGGAALADAANLYLKKQLPPPTTSPGGPTPSLALLLSLRHDFPTDWYAFTKGGAGTHFTATLTIDYFPYLVQNATLTIESITVYAAGAGGNELASATIAVPSTMTSANLKAGTAILDLPQDSNNVLTNADATKEVYAVIAYTAKFS